MHQSPIAGQAPNPAPRRTGAAPWIVAACCLGFLVHVRHYDFLSDDAFITLRYARNLNDGYGLVFNPGERIEGFTSVLWTWLLAAAGFAHLDLVSSSRCLGVAAGLVTIILTFLLSRRLCGASGHAVAALAAPIVLACDGSFACWGASGMETSLFAMLLVASLLATLGGRQKTSAAASAAMVLCRPEGIALAGIVGLARAARRARDGEGRWLAWWWICGGTAAGLFAWRYVYYGDLLPNTYYAKTGATTAQLWRGLAYFLAYCADHETLVIVLVVMIVPALTLGRDARLVAAVAVAALLITILVGGDGLPMYRFAVPPLPPILVLEAALMAALDQRYLRRLLPHPAGRGIVLACAVLALAAVHASPPRLAAQYRLYLDQKNVEVPRWTLVGSWFREHAKRDESLAAVPIGAVSYRSGLVVRDILGLTDRHIARKLMPDLGTGWPGHEKHDGQYILGLRPTYLLLGNIDVTQAPRDPGHWPFIPYTNKWIWAREHDFYDGDVISRDYEPRSVQIAPGMYLNFYELKGRPPG